MALRFFKRCGLIHSDLKPENIVFKLGSDSSVKVIDFGSATYIYEECQDYVQTRPYRAPEIIFGCDYDFAVDMWSLGCILYELLTSKVLFSQKNLHQIVTQVVSLEVSRKIHQFQTGELDCEAQKEGSPRSANSPQPCHARKASILSRESDELWSKTSSKVANPKAKQSLAESPLNEGASLQSEQSVSGKTEVRKLHSKAGVAGRSQKSNDTAQNENAKPGRAGRDARIAQQMAHEISKTFEKFERGSRFKDLVTKGGLTRPAHGEANVAQARGHLAEGRGGQELQLLPHQRRLPGLRVALQEDL